MTNYPFDEGGLRDLSTAFIPEKHYRGLELLADRKGIKFSYLVREIISDYLKRNSSIFEKMETETIRLWLESKSSGIPFETLQAREEAKGE